MNLLIEIAEDGVLKVKSPSLSLGMKFVLPVEAGKNEDQKTFQQKWDALESALDEAEKLDIPRRSHQDILQQLHSY